MENNGMGASTLDYSVAAQPLEEQFLFNWSVGQGLFKSSNDGVFIRHIIAKS